MSNEQTSVFSGIEELDQERKKKRYKKRVRTGQVIALIASVLMAITTSPLLENFEIGAFVFSLAFLAISILSFRWPFAFLLTYSIILSLATLTFLASLLVLYDIFSRNMLSFLFLIASNTLFLLFDVFIIRGTIAARKYELLSKKQTH